MNGTKTHTYTQAKAAGLATMIATMRPDIDHVDEYVRNTTARAFSVVAAALGIPAMVNFQNRFFLYFLFACIALQLCDVCRSCRSCAPSARQRNRGGGPFGLSSRR